MKFKNLLGIFFALALITTTAFGFSAENSRQGFDRNFTDLHQGFTLSKAALAPVFWACFFDSSQQAFLSAKGTDTFLYDQDGNLVDSEENGKNTRYHWSSDNRLLRVESPARCARHNRSNCGRCPTKYETVESYSYYPGDWLHCRWAFMILTVPGFFKPVILV